MNLLIALTWCSFLRNRILANKSLNLIYVWSTQLFSNTKFLCSCYHIISRIERQFTHYSLSQIYIKNVIIFSCWKKFISFIVFLLWKALSSRCSLCTWINNFSNIFPFFFNAFPHVSRWHSIFFKHLYISFSFSLNLRLLTNIRGLCKLFHICWCRFWL